MAKQVQVTRYEAEDGSIHETLAGAEAHEAERALDDWAETAGVGAGGDWSISMIVGAIRKDAHILARILDRFVALEERTG